MKAVVSILIVGASLLGGAAASADGVRPQPTDGAAETRPDGVRVTIVKSGGEYHVETASSGGGHPSTRDCTTSYALAHPDDPAGDDSVLVGITCTDGVVYALVVPADEVVDLDAAAREEAARYVEDVLKPAVRVGVNPAATGLVGLASWFWIEGWSGAAQAPPIAAFGVSIDVRMSSTGVRWDFGDGAVVDGDLGRAYPVESSVRHAYQEPGSHLVTATIALTPEYRVDGGPWITLPPLAATATTEHPVQERQAVLTER